MGVFTLNRLSGRERFLVYALYTGFYPEDTRDFRDELPSVTQGLSKQARYVLEQMITCPIESKRD